MTLVLVFLRLNRFYDTLNKIFVFFSASNIRWGLLETEISKTSKGMSIKTKPKKDNQAAAKKSSHTAVESSTNQRKTSQIASKLTLKRVCTTRWSSRHDALKALRHNYKDVLKALTHIILVSKKTDKISDVLGLKKKMESFEFVFLVVLQYDLLILIDIVFQYLQRKGMNLFEAKSLLKAALDSVMSLRDGFLQSKTTAETLAKSWGTSAAFSQTRTRRKRKMFDELCEDQVLDDAMQLFKTSVFIRCCYIASMQLRCRFKGLEQIVSTYECINPEVLVSKDDDYLHNQAHYLTDIYLQF